MDDEKINSKLEKGDKAGQSDAAGGPMPEVTFTTLVISLNNSALLHLGALKDPDTGETRSNKLLAKHAIDTLQLLKEKTSGNLTAREDELLGNILYDLKMRFVNT